MSARFCRRLSELRESRGLMKSRRGVRPIRLLLVRLRRYGLTAKMRRPSTFSVLDLC